MPIITFWNHNEKAIGQTVSAALAATVMAMEHNYKVVLISADFNDYTLESSFGAQVSNNKLIKSLVNTQQISLDSGITGLLKLADSNRVSPEIIHDYTKIVFKNRLEVLYSPLNIENEEKERVMEKLETIITNASRYYDYVFVDLEKGIKHKEQMNILKKSDVIVENIDQRRKTIEGFFEIKDMEQLMNRIVWNICKCDNFSKYNAKNIERSLLRKQSIYETRYNTLVMEAAQEGRIAELMLQLKTLKDEDSNTVFVSKIEELTQGIIEKYQEIQMNR